MGPICCSETSVSNYNSSLRNSSEEHKPRLLRGGSLKYSGMTIWSHRTRCFCLQFGAVTRFSRVITGDLYGGICVPEDPVAFIYNSATKATGSCITLVRVNQIYLSQKTVPIWCTRQLSWATKFYMAAASGT